MDPIVSRPPTLPEPRRNGLKSVIESKKLRRTSFLDYRRFIFINPDLTVYLHRYPEGEWVCLEAATTASNRGLGLAHSVLHDVRRPAEEAT